MFVGKEPIADNLELHEESSEFLPVKKEILAFPGNKILMGYIPDESKDTDEFYICITEAATKAVKDIIEKMKQQQEKRLYNTLNKTIRDWVPMGSEEEVDENLLKNNRPLIEVEIESQYPIFSSKPEFQIVKAENRRDGYVELKWTSEERIINVYKKRIDQPVQAAPRFITMEVQTTCTYPSNSATQYSYEVEDTTNILEKYAKSIKNYVEDNMDSLSDLLRVNSTINFYTDDYLELINTSASFLTGTTVEEVKEYMSFMDVNRCKDKMIADVVWHPMWSGTVALAYTDEAPFIYHYGPNTEDNVLKAVHGNNLTLIWSCLDGLRPKLILESPREVTKLAFCKFDENILIGGLKNGQIIIWDIRNKLQKVEELEVLTTAQQKYRAYMNSLMTWMKNIHDLAIIRPTAISDLRRSHKGPVTGIIWLSPFYEFSKLGMLKELPEDSEHSMQFITSSEDGNVLLWDLLKKPTIQPGGFKPRRLRRLKQKPSALMSDVSPYRIYHLILKPIYKVIVPRSRKLPLAIASCHETYCSMKYAEIDPNKSKKIALNERIMYKPIFSRVYQKPLTPNLFIGSMEGDFIQMVWEGQDFDSGEIVNSESGVIVSRGRYHDGPINSIEISPAHDIILTVGGRVFALWTPEYQHRPLLWRKRKYLYTSGEWNIHEPHLFTIKVVNGDVECWSLAYDSKYPSFSLPFSSSTLTASAFHSLKLKKQIYGAADQLGSFRLFFVPEDTAPGSTESKCEKFKYFILRELDRKKKFVSWQKVWNEKNEELLLERGTEEQDLHEKELEEKRAKLAESLDKKSAADAIDAAEANKKGPQPGKYVEWIIAQRQAQEEARIKATIISKKQLDTKELEKRRKPLQKLDEENERKKRKQKQRLKEGESIFMNTVTSLFPDIMKEKPLPPPDPYSSLELDSTSLQETYVGFRELKEHAEKFITSHPYNYVFYWKKVIANGRRRREKLANIKKDTRKASTRSTIASSMAIDFMEEFDEKDENESNEKEEKEVTE
ncbi:dynein axonemal intermediate chain 3 isoform X1 [Diorhabda carinulata]|uniref:dynein axonemal intermediate chain 3 isoform X1 n=1 Tax=Diorhabda carinulata TaxID=1163345 RepID=UPI0025A2E8E4|nr:dynein axonemal intermediate chain 3 isoform X1 [Diorhabda carinulata]XP_057667328.1 dynein axonemal intermediate chain 3 isoform X1 [Diorhabda carinulata]